MLRRHCGTILFMLTLLLVSTPSCATPESENPYSQARFEISSDPTAMVLYVHIQGSLSGTFKSMSLYGDGRLVVNEGRRNQVTTEYSTTLSFEKSRALVRMAVGHGLAEWDRTVFNARTLEMNDGKPLVVPTDASHLTISLSLSEYARGEYAAKDHKRRFRFYAPREVNRAHPWILEVEGMMALLKELRATYQTLKAEAP